MSGVVSGVFFGGGRRSVAVTLSGLLGLLPAQEAGRGSIVWEAFAELSPGEWWVLFPILLE